MSQWMFIDCDIYGDGKQWRLAQVSDGCAYFADDFREDLCVFEENGSRRIGPYTDEQLMRCMEVACHVSQFIHPLRTDRENNCLIAPAVWNGMQSARAKLMGIDFEIKE